MIAFTETDENHVPEYNITHQVRIRVRRFRRFRF
jgi:hypothetical protein